jgi:hypothetical protein
VQKMEMATPTLLASDSNPEDVSCKLLIFIMHDKLHDLDVASETFPGQKATSISYSGIYFGPGDLCFMKHELVICLKKLATRSIDARPCHYPACCPLCPLLFCASISVRSLFCLSQSSNHWRWPLSEMIEVVVCAVHPTAKAGLCRVG